MDFLVGILSITFVYTLCGALHEIKLFFRAKREELEGLKK